MTSNLKLQNALYEAYSSGYEEPRRISYWKLESEFGVGDYPEIDMVADAFDLGCRHSLNDVDKLTLGGLLNEMVSWGRQ